MRKIAVRVATCVYAFMLYLSIPTFSPTSFNSNISSNTVDQTFRLWEIWEHSSFPDMDTKKKKKRKRKKNVALKNNNDD